MSRKLYALRALAERPGTEAEGAVAREMLARIEANQATGNDEEPAWEAFTALLSKRMSVQEFSGALDNWAKRRTWICPCGNGLPIDSKCRNEAGHLRIQAEIRLRFKRNDRVVYNYWAYPKDCPGRVAAYVKPKPENGTYPWAWLSIKFDHLKSARQVPIYSAEGWHLSKLTAVPPPMPPSWPIGVKQAMESKPKQEVQS